MADTTITPTGNGGAIPALYRRYLDACTRITLGDDPQAENELQEIVEALARTSGSTLADLISLAHVYQNVAGCRVDDSAALDDQMFAALYRSIRRLADTAHPRRLSPQDLFALELLRGIYTGEPVPRTAWYAAYVASKKAKGHAFCGQGTFSRAIDRLVQSGKVKKGQRGRFSVSP